MGSIHDKGVASLGPGWENLPLPSMKDLRTALSFRAILHLKKGGARNEKEAENCFNLVRQVRARIAELEVQPTPLPSCLSLKKIQTKKGPRCPGPCDNHHVDPHLYCTGPCSH